MKRPEKKNSVKMFSLLFVLLLCPSAQAKLHKVEWSTSLMLPSPVWDAKKKYSAKGSVAKKLYQIRKNRRMGAGLKCVEGAKALLNQSKALQPWLAHERLICAKQVLRAQKKRTGPLRRALDYIDANQGWLSYGPVSFYLRKHYASGWLAYVRRVAKVNRDQAWRGVSRLLEISEWLSQNDVAEVYKIAGELAFIQQNIKLAESYFMRSLKEKESKDVRKKLVAIRTKLLSKTPDEGVKPGASAGEAVEMSEKERKIVKQMRTALRSGDWVSATEDGIELIEKYPGGTKAQWAEKKIGHIYLNLARKRKEKFTLLKKRILGLMLKADGQRLANWGQRVYAKGFYSDAVVLAESAVEKLGSMPLSTKVILLAGKGAVAAGDYERAKKHFGDLIKSHSGTEASREAHFRLGLLHYRLQKDSAAVAQFERYLALPDHEQFEMQSLYWLWRSQQRLKSSLAKKVKEKLIAEYPLTYYGLRAQAEGQQGNLTLPKAEPSEIKVTMHLNDAEKSAWNLFENFVRAGWFAEATMILKFLPEPQNPNEKLVKARLYGLARNHHRAIELANSAWDEDGDYVRIEWVKLAYPKEYHDWVVRESKDNKIDSDLIMGLIKQESSFRTDVVSVAGAMGLTQMMPATARDVRGFLRRKNVKIPQDMFQPEMNIIFGTHYLKRLVRAFGGHVPLALAAFNVGIGNIRRWMGSRAELRDLQKHLTSAPEKEIWIDELPWSETSFYVKAVLRNLLIYRILNDGGTKVESAAWTKSSLKAQHLDEPISPSAQLRHVKPSYKL